ncbi:hypothetical protein QYZ44_07335 [Vibrio parahaemolyticus]|nr:hypothetical protein [Vibrio parahaemolyticus]MDN4709653.1 hypothetical protein [Vibrio parahaemolyticus]
MATQYRNPIKLALGATVLTLYGGFIALGVSFDGENMKAIEFRLAGQLLLLFFSVIGGALVSIALNEIRKSSLNNSTD